MDWIFLVFTFQRSSDPIKEESLPSLIKVRHSEVIWEGFVYCMSSFQSALKQRVISWKCLTLLSKSLGRRVGFRLWTGYESLSDVCSVVPFTYATGPPFLSSVPPSHFRTPSLATLILTKRISVSGLTTEKDTMTSLLHFSSCLGLRPWWQHLRHTMATGTGAMKGKVAVWKPSLFFRPVDEVPCCLLSKNAHYSKCCSYSLQLRQSSYVYSAFY